MGCLVLRCHIWGYTVCQCPIKRTPCLYELNLVFSASVWCTDMSRLTGKATICICENKGPDQLRSNCEADQRLCFRYTHSTVPLLSKSKISSLKPSSVLIQPGLCLTCLETLSLVFPRGGSYVEMSLSIFLSHILYISVRETTADKLPESAAGNSHLGHP